MSRIAKSPITIASGIEVKIDGQQVTAKGSRGALEMTVHPDVSVQLEDGVVSGAHEERLAPALAQRSHGPHRVLETANACQ